MVNLTKVKENCEREALEEWRETAAKKPKLRTYQTIKNDVEVLRHVKCNLSRALRSLLTWLRIGDLNLELEVSRRRNLPVMVRLCRVCPGGVVVVENHFLLECPRHRQLRQELVRAMEEDALTMGGKGG